MAQRFEVHPDNPQARFLKQAAQILDKGGIAAIPTDSSYARVDNRQYRLLKSATPGPFTFILEATKEVPRRVSHPSRRTIGLRVPDHRVTQDLLALLGQPLLATTLIPPGESEPLNDPDDIAERYDKLLQVVVDAGACPLQPTTVVDMTGDEAEIVRLGRGDPALLGL